MTGRDRTQVEHFKETARELECDEDENRFNETLKRVAKAPVKKKPAAPTED